MYLIDTNIWLELLLNQEKAEEVRQFNKRIEGHLLAITEISLYSIGVVLSRLKRDDAFLDFLSDTIEDTAVVRIRLGLNDLKKIIPLKQELKLDFDDTYQYLAAEKFGYTLVSYDKDFDKTERKRVTTKQVLETLK